MPDICFGTFGQSCWKGIFCRSGLYCKRNRIFFFSVIITNLSFFFSKFQTCNDICCLVHSSSPSAIPSIGKVMQSRLLFACMFQAHLLIPLLFQAVLLTTSDLSSDISLFLFSFHRILLILLFRLYTLFSPSRLRNNTPRFPDRIREILC